MGPMDDKETVFLVIIFTLGFAVLQTAFAAVSIDLQNQKKTERVCSDV